MIVLFLVFVFITSEVKSITNQLPLDLKERQGFGVTTTDYENYIERPCRIYDVNCIRKFFAEHYRCNITYGPVPDPLYIPDYSLHLPRINVTVTALTVEYNRLNGMIVEFYINTKTDKLVLAVDFEGLRFNGNDNYFQFQRPGKEPLVTNDSFNVTYQSVGSTITIPNLKNLQLKDSEIFSYSNTRLVPIYQIGPKVFGDPRLLPTAVDFLRDPQSNIPEEFLLESIFFIASFIQYSICDFGLALL